MGNCSSTKKEKRISKTENESRVDNDVVVDRIDRLEMEQNIGIPKNPFVDKRIYNITNFSNLSTHNAITRDSNTQSFPQNNHNTERNYQSIPFKSTRSKSLLQKRIDSKISQKEFEIPVDNQIIFQERSIKPFESYDLVTKIGSGSYGSVFLVRHKQMKINRAMKKIKKEEVFSPDEEMQILDEVNILKKLDHPNIVKIFELYNTKDAYYYLFEYCSRGELLNYLKTKLTPVQISVIFYQILLGIQYLHSNNITHRDLKLENILISHQDKKGFFSIKIIDFGGAKIFNKNKTEKAVIGSSYYIAPEVIEMNYNEKCDTWSCGVILYMLIVGIPPFNGNTDKIILEKILSGDFNKTAPRWLKASKEVRDLISRLLDVNIETRLTAKEALEHEWFKINKTKEILTDIPSDKLLYFTENLISYKFESKLQQVVLLFIVNNFISEKDNEELNDVLKLFRLFDSEMKGKLTKEDLFKGLKLTLNEDIIIEKIDDVFLTLDAGHNGFIKYEEFLCACLTKEKLINEHNLYFAFKYFDKKNLGKLTIEELKEIFKMEDDDLSKEVLINIINDMDTVGNGMIDFIDFKLMMRNMICN